MRSWTGLVVARPTHEGDEMASRLPTHLHPVAGRPLVWHAVSSLVAIDPAPERIVVVGDLPDELFQDVPAEVSVVGEVAGAFEASSGGEGLVLLSQAATLAPPESLGGLLTAAPGAWLADSQGGAAAVSLDRDTAAQWDRGFEPAMSDLLSGAAASGGPALVVRCREDLSRAVRVVRDRLVAQLMDGGVTFLLPDSVLVDVDVRIGRDTLVYPGAVIEGQTTIGAETVIGPGCRIVSSWIGSGVELKGWNYLANTSIRNRAILEPYVRRGFD